ncbi:MAG: four helix bundle protein [Mariniphaga sp.]
MESKRNMAGGFRELTVYKKAFALAMDIFEITKTFPPEEKYELTDQIRRSSRAVCRAIGEGYRKRQYPKHFSSKMSDSDMENTETQVSLDFALECKYISRKEYDSLLQKSEEVGRLLNHMVENPEKYLPRRH